MNIPKLILMNASMGYGRTSLGGAQSILAGLGVQTAIVPTAMVSAPTGGAFGEVYRRETMDILEGSLSHFSRIGLQFDAVATGSIASAAAVERIREYLSGLSCVKLVDPVFGDYGKLYGGFDGVHVKALTRLCAEANVITPNLTESAFLLGRELPRVMTVAEARDWLRRLQDMGAACPVVTSVELCDFPGCVTTLALEGEQLYAIPAPRLDRSFFGTGDALAAYLAGRLAKGESFARSVLLAADFVRAALEAAARRGGLPQEGMPLESFVPLLSGEWKPELRLYSL